MRRACLERHDQEGFAGYHSPVYKGLKRIHSEVAAELANHLADEVVPIVRSKFLGLWRAAFNERVAAFLSTPKKRPRACKKSFGKTRCNRPHARRYARIDARNLLFVTHLLRPSWIFVASTPRTLCKPSSWLL